MLLFIYLCYVSIFHDLLCMKISATDVFYCNFLHKNFFLWQLYLIMDVWIDIKYNRTFLRKPQLFNKTTTYILNN